MIVVDSSVWIDYFNGAETPEVDELVALVDRQPIIVGDLILAEVLQGFRDRREAETARRGLSGFFFHAMVGRDIALASARNYRKLRARGVTVKTVDMLIATFCMEHGHRLLHSDRDFDLMERHLNLQVIRDAPR